MQANTRKERFQRTYVLQMLNSTQKVIADLGQNPHLVLALEVNCGGSLSKEQTD